MIIGYIVTCTIVLEGSFNDRAYSISYVKLRIQAVENNLPRVVVITDSHNFISIWKKGSDISS